MANTLKDFVTDIILDLGKDLEELDKTIDHITECARKEKKGNCACVSDDVVKQWAIDYLTGNVKQEKVVTKKEKKVNKVEEKIKSEESLGAKEKAFGKDYAITSLF